MTHSDGCDSGGGDVSGGVAMRTGTAVMVMIQVELTAMVVVQAKRKQAMRGGNRGTRGKKSICIGKEGNLQEGQKVSHPEHKETEQQRGKSKL